VKLTEAWPARAATSLGLAPAAIHNATVVSGWGAIARTEDQAHQVVLDLINESHP
jgi:hypothetical protein